MPGEKKELTAWGRWVQTQPRGTMTEAQFATGLAYCTVHAAQTRLMTREVAELLSRFSKGAVAVADILDPGFADRRKARKNPKRKAVA